MCYRTADELSSNNAHTTSPPVQLLQKGSSGPSKGNTPLVVAAAKHTDYVYVLGAL